MSAEQRPPRTREETRALLRQLRRQLRDAKIREGRLAPRTQRELEPWLQGVHERFGIVDEGPDDDPPAA